MLVDALYIASNGVIMGGRTWSTPSGVAAWLRLRIPRLDYGGVTRESHRSWRGNTHGVRLVVRTYPSKHRLEAWRKRVGGAS